MIPTKTTLSSTSNIKSILLLLLLFNCSLFSLLVLLSLFSIEHYQYIHHFPAFNQPPHFHIQLHIINRTLIDNILYSINHIPNSYLNESLLQVNNSK